MSRELKADQSIHISPINGPVVCPAKIQCTLTNPDGSPQEHYKDWDVAEKVWNEQNEAKYGLIPKNTKKIPPREREVFAAHIKKDDLIWDEDRQDFIIVMGKENPADHPGFGEVVLKVEDGEDSHLDFAYVGFPSTLTKIRSRGNFATGFKATEEDLGREMDFDHPITVNEDGSIEHHNGVYAPTATTFAGEVGDPDVELDSSKWELLTGHTGQYGYNGAVMHPSEYIGGGLAKYILENPGTYVSIVVTDMDAYDDPEFEGDEAVGWAIARLKD